MVAARMRAALVVAATVAGLVGTLGWEAGASPSSSSPSSGSLPPEAAEHVPSCGPARPNQARCYAIRVVPGNGGVSPFRRPTSSTTRAPTTSIPTTVPPSSTTVPPSSTTVPPSSTSTPTTLPSTTAGPTTTLATSACRYTYTFGGYTPCVLQSAYSLPSATQGSGQTVALVDAYDAPSLESDLGVYRAQFGLPACTTANGCFRKVNQNGAQGGYPGADSGWAQETSLDVDMVSAVCPNCKILVVEANSAYTNDLNTAENTAANLGATEISNSWGGPEGFFPSQSAFNHPGIAITVSSGDSGYGVQFPASSNYVTAVGGTSLRAAPATARGWTETAWSGAGSGCSQWFAQDTWQAGSPCSTRSVADVSADADPSTPVDVYDSTPDSSGAHGWLLFGGTSVASPIIAAVYALAGNASTVTYGSFPYHHASSLWDVVSGSNGSCGGSSICTAGPGYDGPTGLGTPNGVSGF